MKKRVRELVGLDELECEDDDSENDEILLFMVVASGVMANACFEIPHLRSPNLHRNRLHVLECMRSWPDDMFQRQFRLERVDFFWLLSVIAPALEKNEEMARRSSGSAVNPEMKLAMTLRLLAGATYLEFVWYEVRVDHIWYYVKPVLVAIHQLVNNVKLPYTPSELDAVISDWHEAMDKKYPGHDIFPGVAGAADGLVVERTKPKKRELEIPEAEGGGTRDFRSYLNRSAVWAWVAMAIVGAYGEFLMFEINWPGATNDSTAFTQSEGMNWLQWMDNVAEKGVIVGDDAFSSIHSRMLTPFTKRQLTYARSISDVQYKKMRAFNHLLSSQRITSERAFGMLVRRFGCLWKPLEREEKNSRLMVIVCVKLHNICVERWKLNNPGNFRPEAPMNANVPEEVNTVDNDEVNERLQNQYRGAPRHAKQNPIRLAMAEHIYSKGIHMGSEDAFLVHFD